MSEFYSKYFEYFCVQKDSLNDANLFLQVRQILEIEFNNLLAAATDRQVLAECEVPKS
jgi:hypothetical protein